MDFGALFANTGNLVLALTIIPFVVIALIILLVVLRNGAKVRASRNWDSTTGRVLYSGVGSRRSTRSGGGTSTTYYPQVVYEYEVRGQRYQSQRLSFGTVSYGSSRTAQNMAARYALGGPVEVFYNPTKPEEAVLERKSGSNKALVLVVALIAVILVVTAVGLNVAMGSVGGFVNSITNITSPNTPAPTPTKITAPTATLGK